MWRFMSQGVSVYKLARGLGGPAVSSAPLTRQPVDTQTAVDTTVVDEPPVDSQRFETLFYLAPLDYVLDVASACPATSYQVWST